jgi:hypothetical protein
MSKDVGRQQALQTASHPYCGMLLLEDSVVTIVRKDFHCFKYLK